MCTSRPSSATHTPYYICVLRILLHMCCSKPSSATHTPTHTTTCVLLRILAHMRTSYYSIGAPLGPRSRRILLHSCTSYYYICAPLGALIPRRLAWVTRHIFHTNSTPIKEKYTRWKHVADGCWRMLTYADICWRMLTYADQRKCTHRLTGGGSVGLEACCGAKISLPKKWKKRKKRKKRPLSARWRTRARGVLECRGMRKGVHAGPVCRGWGVGVSMLERRLCCYGAGKRASIQP